MKRKKTNKQTTNKGEAMTKETKALVPAAEAAPARPLMELTVDDVLKQVSKIKDLMGKAMELGVHYGKVPGCGDKPTLLQPGAQKLGLMFRLLPRYETSVTDLGNGHREIKSICSLFNPNGDFLGSGEGSCSTMESKYRWRQADRVCPACGKPTIIKGRAEYGGGWLCFGKKGGCGAKFQDADPAIAGQKVGRVENTDIADTYNTVLKMANKRALVAATITTTAASELFTQDVEDYAPMADQADIVTPADPAPKPVMGNSHKAAELAPTTAANSELDTATGSQSSLILTLCDKAGLNWRDEVAKLKLSDPLTKRDASVLIDYLRRMPAGAAR